MKLDYGEALSGSQVLIKDRHRIELHLCRVDPELFALLMFSGDTHGQASKSKQQGPYHAKDQAQAALNAITHELQGLGYEREDGTLIWQIQAQAELRSMREQRTAHAVDTTFTPLGILPEED